MDTNLVLLTGTVVSVIERTVGPQGRTLTELRLALARPGRKGEAETPTVLPITIWAPDVGAAVLGLPDGMPVTVVGRLHALEWNTKLYLDVIAETVSVAVAAGSGEPVAPAPRPVPQAPPREAAEDVPF
jgi:hypothetical protein